MNVILEKRRNEKPLTRWLWGLFSTFRKFWHETHCWSWLTHCWLRESTKRRIHTNIFVLWVCTIRWICSCTHCNISLLQTWKSCKVGKLRMLPPIRLKVSHWNLKKRRMKLAVNKWEFQHANFLNFFSFLVIGF